MHYRLQFSFLFSPTGGLFPPESHEYEVFRFALSHYQDIPKLVPQVDMVKMGNSFSMTYACEYGSGKKTQFDLKNIHTFFSFNFVYCNQCGKKWGITALQKFSLCPCYIHGLL